MDIDKYIKFLKSNEEKVIYHNDTITTNDSGKKCIRLGGSTQHKKIREFVREFYDSNIDTNYVENNKILKEKYGHLDVSKFETVEEVNTYITFQIRADRFCGGHFSMFVKEGHLLIALERLKELTV